MSNSFGTKIKYTIFGQSHSEYLGITIDGLKAGITIDFVEINYYLNQRKAKSNVSTKRIEPDTYEIICGYENDKTTGNPLTIIFKNQKQNSADYNDLKHWPRPGHADYPAMIKYQNNHDQRGGGAFSGRMSLPIVFAGYLMKQVLELEYPDLQVITNIKNFNQKEYFNYYDLRKLVADKLMIAYQVTNINEIALLSKEKQKEFALTLADNIQQEILSIQNSLNINLLDAFDDLTSKNDTLGGSLQSIILNAPTGIGQPFFCSCESIISHLLYAIPSVKQVGFGNDDMFLNSYGSKVKDEYLYLDNRGYTLMNYNGGLLGGLTTGEDIVINTLFKPISSLPQSQISYHLKSEKLEVFNIEGRHDLTIINRVIPVVNAMLYIGLMELIENN